jgi:excisionase family DNA binding protein
MPRARAIFPIAVSAEHAAKALHVPARKIRDAIASGDLAAYKEPEGQRIRILVRSLEQWVSTKWTRTQIRRKISRSA